MKKSMPCHKHASCAMPLRLQPSLSSSVRYQRIRPAVKGLRPRLGRRCATSISMSQPAPLWQGHQSHPGMTRATDDGKHPKAPISYSYDVLWRLRADTCLYATTRDSWLSCAPAESPQPELAGDAEAASSDSESSVRLSMPRRSRMVTFTCNKCGKQPIMPCTVCPQSCTCA